MRAPRLRCYLYRTLWKEPYTAYGSVWPSRPAGWIRGQSFLTHCDRRVGGADRQTQTNIYFAKETYSRQTQRKPERAHPQASRWPPWLVSIWHRNSLLMIDLKVFRGGFISPDMCNIDTLPPLTSTAQYIFNRCVIPRCCIHCRNPLMNSMCHYS